MEKKYALQNDDTPTPNIDPNSISRKLQIAKNKKEMKNHSASTTENAQRIENILRKTRGQLGVPEGYFYLIWGYATLLTSIIITLVTIRTPCPHIGILWTLIPTIGLIGSLILIRCQRGQKNLFGPARRNIAWAWMIIGPSIGLVTLYAPDPLSMQLLLVGIGIAVNGITLQWNLLKITGIAIIGLSATLLLIPHPARTIAFGLFTAIGMGIPGHLLAHRKQR